MRPTILHLGAAVASSVLFVSLAVLTSRSLAWGICDTLTRDSPALYAYVESIDGKLLFSCAVYRPKPGVVPRGWRWGTDRAFNYRPSDAPWFDVGGLAFCHAPMTATRSDSRTYVMIPGWLSMPTAALPGLYLLALKWRRGRSGVCVACGYDLRATPDRCPECGAVPEQRPEAAG